MLTDAIWLKIGTQYDLNLERNTVALNESCVYSRIGLFILAGRSSATLKVNGKGKGRILHKCKGKVAEGKGNVAVIEFKNLFINSISGTVSRVG